MAQYRQYRHMGFILNSAFVFTSFRDLVYQFPDAFYKISFLIDLVICILWSICIKQWLCCFEFLVIIWWHMCSRYTFWSKTCVTSAGKMLWWISGQTSCWILSMYALNYLSVIRVWAPSVTRDHQLELGGLAPLLAVTSLFLSLFGTDKNRYCAWLCGPACDAKAEAQTCDKNIC
jgi:hypothetical protein